MRLRERRSQLGPGVHRGLMRAVSVPLAGVLLVGMCAPPAWAASSEDHLLGITRTTIYGAVLGGLLGLTGSLIAREKYKDDTVRWGVALGAFGGFAYGVASRGAGEERDDFSSANREAWRNQDASSSPAPVPARGSLSARARIRALSGPVVGDEVGHGDLEKEVREDI